MRKNGINRNLTQIAGGVCAPDGFSAGGVYCGIRKKDNLVSRETNSTILEDLGLITADKRCPVACVYAKDGVLGAPSKITQRHLKSGYARAILVNSGIANVYGDGAERSALEICRAYAGKALITPDEVAIASTGSVGERFPRCRL